MVKLVLLIVLFSLANIIHAQSKYQQIKAIKGDGIYTILTKNGYNYSKYNKEFVQLNKKNIGKNNTVYIGKTYKLPLKNSSFISKTVDLPIFGNEKSQVIIDSDTLKNAVYYLISGHGGPDPGATVKYGKTMISEDEYAYDVTLRLAKKLIEKGAQVYLIIKDTNDGIRDDKVLSIDYDEINYNNNSIPLNQLKRLKQRTKAVNDLFLKHPKSYQRIIAIHVDSRNKDKNIDVFFYHHENSPKGKKTASSIYNSFKKNYKKHQPNRQYTGTIKSRTNLYLIKNTLAPIVYIELGNIKNKKDQKRIINYKNREALAKWIFEGVLADYSLML